MENSNKKKRKATNDSLKVMYFGFLDRRRVYGLGNLGAGLELVWCSIWGLATAFVACGLDLGPVCGSMCSVCVGCEN